MITNDQITKHIKGLLPFRTYNVCGFFNQHGNYSIWSYSTAILEVKPDKELVFFNNLYYSPATSKVQNIICDLLDLAKQRNRRIYTKKNITDGVGEPIKLLKK